MPDNPDTAAIKSIFADPEVAKRIVHLATTKKPQGWGRDSYAPYYKEPYGKQLQELADEMMKTKQSIVFDYKRFCYDEKNLSRVSERTLYLRVNQSRNYLLREMDPYIEGHPYAKWGMMTKVRVDHEIGVLIEYIQELQQAVEEGRAMLRPMLVSPSSDKPKWRKAMEDWLEDDTDVRPFVKENLCLTREERQELETTLAGMKNILADIETTHVKLVRMT